MGLNKKGLPEALFSPRLGSHSRQDRPRIAATQGANEGEAGTPVRKGYGNAPSKSSRWVVTPFCAHRLSELVCVVPPPF